MRQKDPKTSEEWQEAVDWASLLRSIHDCKLYGLIEGGPDIKVERCDYILERGRDRGVHPRPLSELLPLLEAFTG